MISGDATASSLQAHGNMLHMPASCPARTSRTFIYGVSTFRVHDSPFLIGTPGRYS
ncbi:hypothetical protein Ssi03_67770 [Sphaerisporangium siamense]|nr:hypothetical protein Ssi03_67770 [Sphaerisporangium siamense]